MSKIGLLHILGIPNARLCAKNQEKVMMKSWENAKKLVFPAHFRHFRPEKMFFQNRAPAHFRYCHFALMCKIPWKNIKYSSRNSRNTVQKPVLLTIEFSVNFVWARTNSGQYQSTVRHVYLQLKSRNTKLVYKQVQKGKTSKTFKKMIQIRTGNVVSLT